MSTLKSATVETSLPATPPAAAVTTPALRHTGIVRVTHWIITLCFFALVLTGGEIVVSHPRFYWGETGNVLTEPWLKLPIPSSRRLVPSGYNYVLPDQNGWSRALHFQTAWVTVFTGLLYVIWGVVSGHFRKHLAPQTKDLSPQGFANVIAQHLRFGGSGSDAWSYNVVQRLTYLFVIFILFPLVIWTGLALSPAFDSAFPLTVTLLGGRQSARSLHFLVSLALLLFLFVHVTLVWKSGFRNRMRAMITGKSTPSKEQL